MRWPSSCCLLFASIRSRAQTSTFRFACPILLVLELPAEMTTTKTVRVVGIDLGAQKTIVVADDGEIIRTDTGSVARPSYLSFSNGKRVYGDEAFAQITSEYTLPLVSAMIGKTLEEIQALPWSRFLRIQPQADEKGRVYLAINHGMECPALEQEDKFYLTTLLAMYVADLRHQLALALPGVSLQYVFTKALPTPRALEEFHLACEVAGLRRESVRVVHPIDSLVAVYAKKIAGLGGAQSLSMEGKTVLLVDMGHTACHMVGVRFGPPQEGENGGEAAPLALPGIVGRVSSEEIGGIEYDIALFDHFVQTLKEKHGGGAGAGGEGGGEFIFPSSKRGLRLLLSCEKVKKLLSQLHEGVVVVENLLPPDGQDAPLSLSREVFSVLVKRYSSLFLRLLEEATGGGEIEGVEVSGGGCRMPCVQQQLLDKLTNGDKLTALDDKLKTPRPLLGMKLDDSSLAYGGLLRLAQGEGGEGEGVYPPFLSPFSLYPTEEVQQLKEREEVMRRYEQLFSRLFSLGNEIEGKILQMKSVAEREGGTGAAGGVDRGAVLKCVGEYERELERVNDEYSEEEYSYTPKHPHGEGEEEREGEREDLSLLSPRLSLRYQNLLSLLRDVACDSTLLLSSYYEQKLKSEQELERELQKASEEREAEEGEEGAEEGGRGGRDVDRKLKKSDRIRLVQKNKEEGGELFKGGNFKLAVIRYQKALQHLLVLIEGAGGEYPPLSDEERRDFTSLRVSLLSNISICYGKLNNSEQLFSFLQQVLAIEPAHGKTLFRRGGYYEGKRDWEKALGDYQKALEGVRGVEGGGAEEKILLKCVERVKKEIEREKVKEKKMWSKAFS